MPINQLTPMAEVTQYLEDNLNRIEQVILRNLQHVGEQCLNAGRSTKSYIDRTGNLRSSVGYVIVKEGRIIKSSDFEVVKQGGEGSKEGSAYARQLAREFPKGIVLIVVAGMNYATYVSAKGYDVLDSAELLADKLVPAMLKQLGIKIR